MIFSIFCNSFTGLFFLKSGNNILYNVQACLISNASRILPSKNLREDGNFFRLSKEENHEKDKETREKYILIQKRAPSSILIEII